MLENEKDLYRVGKSRDDYMGFSPHPTEADVFFTSGHPSRGGNLGFQKSDDGGAT
ncbi:exo-alpha-sialidase, partial [Candidatus Kaiserbacteria bacterium]|nr:exo-alpha-sialidase [Candidatus Kaiserbacteria bacterium]